MSTPRFAASEVTNNSSCVISPKRIIVGADTPVVRYEVGGKADLKAGAAFTVVAAAKQPDGTFTAERISVGRDGGVPN